MTANTTASMDELLKQYEHIARDADDVQDKCIRLIQIIIDKMDANMDNYQEACDVAILWFVYCALKYSTLDSSIYPTYIKKMFNIFCFCSNYIANV